MLLSFLEKLCKQNETFKESSDKSSLRNLAEALKGSSD
jgi:hypothetical protein